MKLNLAERLLINNLLRSAVQRFYEGPVLRSMGGDVRGGTVLEIGCGRGVGIEVILEQFHAAHVYGIDLDPLQIKLASKRLQGRYDGLFTLAQGMPNDCFLQTRASTRSSISARCTMSRIGRPQSQRSGECSSLEAPSSSRKSRELPSNDGFTVACWSTRLRIASANPSSWRRQ